MIMKLILNQIEIETILWVYESEKKKRKFFVDVEVEFDTGESIFTDNIADTLGSCTVERLVREVTHEKDFNLLERLVYEISEAILALPQVQNVVVRVEKSDCLDYTRSVVIQVRREKEKSLD